MSVLYLIQFFFMFLGSNNPEIGPIYKFENEDTIDGLPLVSKSILFFDLNL